VTAAELLAAAYGSISGMVGRLPAGDFERRSRCAGWAVGDVLFHLLLDAQRALVTFATPVETEPDVDAVTYWSPFRPGGTGSAAAQAHARFVRLAARAYSGPPGLVAHWADTAAAVPPAPPPRPLVVVRRTLDGLLGAHLPVGWDDVTYALKGTGRVGLDDDDRLALGDLAGAFPLLG